MCPSSGQGQQFFTIFSTPDIPDRFKRQQLWRFSSPSGTRLGSIDLLEIQYSSGMLRHLSHAVSMKESSEVLRNYKHLSQLIPIDIQHEANYDTDTSTNDGTYLCTTKSWPHNSIHPIATSVINFCNPLPGAFLHHVPFCKFSGRRNQAFPPLLSERERESTSP